MGDYSRIPEVLADHLGEVATDGGIKASDVANIVGKIVGNEPFNCYPGIPGAGCYNLAVFVSLKSKSHRKGRGDGHLTCRQAIEKIVSHMQGPCASVTRNAVFITDYWDGDAFEDWKDNLRMIVNSGAYLEVYLLAGDKVCEIKT